MQLGDCGQEMALIRRMTEGSKVFLSREENQHFIKESVQTNRLHVIRALASTFVPVCLHLDICPVFFGMF